MNIASLLILIADSLTKAKSFAVVYRTTLTLIGLTLASLLVLWLFAFKPHTLILVAIVAFLTHVYGTRILAWVKARVGP